MALLSQSFSDFLRLMVVHVGVKGWPLAYTPEGLSPQTQQYGWDYLAASDSAWR